MDYGMSVAHNAAWMQQQQQMQRPGMTLLERRKLNMQGQPLPSTSTFSTMSTASLPSPSALPLMSHYVPSQQSVWQQEPQQQVQPQMMANVSQLQYEAEFQLRTIQQQQMEAMQRQQQQQQSRQSLGNNVSAKEKMSMHFLLNHDVVQPQSKESQICQSLERQPLVITPVSNHSLSASVMSPMGQYYNRPPQWNHGSSGISPTYQTLSIQTPGSERGVATHPLLTPTAVVGATGALSLNSPVGNIAIRSAVSTPLVTPRRAFQGKKLFKQFWTEEEDQLLAEIVRKYRPRSWDKLAAEFMPTRTGGQLRARWEYVILRRGQQRSFTEEEDKIILETYAKVGTSWAQIADKLMNRKDQEVKHRFRKLQRKMKHGGQEGGVSTSVDNDNKHENDDCAEMTSDEDGENSSTD